MGFIFDTLEFQKTRRFLNDLGIRNIDSLLICSEEVLLQSNKLKYNEGIYEAYVQIGYAYFSLGKIDTALNYFNQSLLVAKEINRKIFQAGSELWIGECYKEQSQFEKAISHLIEAEKIARSENQIVLLIKVYQTKAATYRLMKDYEVSLKYCNLILKDFYKNLSTFERYRVDLHIANVYNDQQKYSQALEHYMKAKFIADSLREPKFIALLNQNIGNVYFHMSEFFKAESYMNKSLRYFADINDLTNLEISNRTMGGIKFQQGDYENAEQFFFRSIRIAKSQKNFRVIVANYQNLSLVYKVLYIKTKKINYLNKEIASLNLRNAFKDSLYRIESIKATHELEKKYETEKKDSQIALLEKESELQKTRQKYLFVGMGFLIMIAFSLVIVIRYVRKTNSTLESQKKQIEKQNVLLENSINTQNKLFSIIAHDLRSPLASIANISELVKITFADKDYKSAMQLIDKLEIRNSQVLQLTDNLLSWASSQTGMIEYRPDSYNLNNLLQEVLCIFEETCTQKNIKLELEVSEDIFVFIDVLTMKTVFRNLINNAIKFTNEGGLVTVSIYIENSQAIVTISDTGIGIPEEIQPIVFEMTNKKQKTGTQGEKSSGLGLFICKEFVERNNGRIWLTSVDGQGSAFYVALLLSEKDISNHTQTSQLC